MNNYLFTTIHSIALKYSFTDAIIIFFAEPFIYIAIVGISLFYIFSKNDIHRKITKEFVLKKIKFFLPVMLSTVVGWAIGNVLKYVFHTARPFLALPGVQTLFTETAYAFPSGHSATIAAFAFAIFFRNKRLGYIAFIAALIIGFARVAAGVHFPFDIIGGYIVGFVVAFLFKTL